jgi:hypothetical protein
MIGAPVLVAGFATFNAWGEAIARDAVRRRLARTGPVTKCARPVAQGGQGRGANRGHFGQSSMGKDTSCD